MSNFQRPYATRYDGTSPVHFLHIDGAQHFSPMCPAIKKFMQRLSSLTALILSAHIHSFEHTTGVNLLSSLLTC